MATVRFTCLSCGKRFKSKSTKPGKIIRCLYCNAEIQGEPDNSQLHQTPLHLVCPRCRTRFKAKKEKRGKFIKCRVCDSEIPIPDN